MRRSVFICALVALAVPAAAHGRPGDRDESFSGDGLVKAVSTTDVTSTAGYRAFAIQSDGSIVVAGGADDAISLRRFRPDGSVDTSFGGDGTALHSAGPNSHASELAIDSQGRLVAAGSVGTGGVDGDFVVARFLPDGTLDTGFGDGGIVRVGFPNFENLGALALTEDDGIVLAGTGSGGTDSIAILVAKLDAAGDPDASFSGDGKQLIPLSELGGVGGAAVGGDGSIFIGSGAFTHGLPTGVSLVRLDPAGEPVTGYGDDGIASAPGETTTAAFVDSLDLDSQGRVLVAGNACSFLHIYCVGRVRRFTTGGELDSSFADGGLYAQDGGIAETIALADGRVLLAGFERNRKPTRDDFGLRRLLADGSPDPSFSDDGLVSTDFKFEDDGAIDAATAPDGRIVLMGTAYPGVGLARYEVADGPADADADGRLDRSDRCPQRHSTHRTGCSQVARKVTIELRGERLRGRIVCELKPCANGERVRLLLRRPGPDRLVGHDRSKGGNGRWQEPAPDEPGRVYAVVKRSIEPEVGRCRRDRSGTATIERRDRAD